MEFDCNVNFVPMKGEASVKFNGWFGFVGKRNSGGEPGDGWKWGGWVIVDWGNCLFLLLMILERWK